MKKNGGSPSCLPLQLNLAAATLDFYRATCFSHHPGDDDDMAHAGMPPAGHLEGGGMGRAGGQFTGSLRGTACLVKGMPAWGRSRQRPSCSCHPYWIYQWTLDLLASPFPPSLTHSVIKYLSLRGSHSCPTFPLLPLPHAACQENSNLSPHLFTAGKEKEAVGEEQAMGLPGLGSSPSPSLSLPLCNLHSPLPTILHALCGSVFSSPLSVLGLLAGRTVFLG